MRGVDGPAAERERRHVHLLHPERVEPGHRPHHVDQRVELADLVEVHRVHRHPVHARLGLGQPPEHGLGAAP